MKKIFYSVEQDIKDENIFESYEEEKIKVIPFEYDKVTSSFFHINYTEYLKNHKEYPGKGQIVFPMKPMILANSPKIQPQLKQLEQEQKADAKRFSKSKNPQYQLPNPSKVLELAIFLSLMPRNTFESLAHINESDLYYIFKEALIECDMQRIPSPIYHLAANVVYNELQFDDNLIVVLSWSMLPALMLLLPVLDDETCVVLPEFDNTFLGFKAHKLLLQFFCEEIPRIHWLQLETIIFRDEQDSLKSESKFRLASCESNSKATMSLDDLSSKNVFYLGSIPSNLDFFYDTLYIELGKLRGGFLYTNWTVLQRNMYFSARSTLLETAIIQAVVQLPRLLRSGAKNFGAGLILDKPNKKREKIRMIAIPHSTQEGENALDIRKVLEAMDKENNLADIARNVPLHIIHNNSELRLNPSYYLALDTLEPKKNVLGDFADILFYHKARKKIVLHNGEELLNNDEMRVEEISLNDIDHSSSFVFSEDKKFTSVKISANLRSHFVRAGDILFAFKGSQSSIGKCGFVPQIQDQTLTNQSTCIIRTKGTADNVWLYYQLKSPAVREWILAHANAAQSLVISLELLKSLPLKSYNTKLANLIDADHQLMLKHYNQVVEHKKILRQIRDKIHAHIDK